MLVDGIDRANHPNIATIHGLEESGSPTRWHGVTTGNAPWTEKTMKSVGKSLKYHVYPHVYQTFFDETSLRYDGEAAKLACSRTLAFLRALA